MKHLGTRLGAHRPTRDLRAAGELPDGAFGYALEVPADEGPWWVVWVHPDPVAVTLPAPPAEARDAAGTDLPPPGPVPQAGVRPVFVHLPAGRRR